MIKVLIVDDEELNRDIIKRFGNWEVYGMNIVGEAADGLEAIRFIVEWSPDIVITDMRMPGMDGTELLHWIHEQFPAIKLIVVSGYDDFVYMKQAILSKAKDYLLKPIDPIELNAILRVCRDEIESDMATEQAGVFDIELMKLIKNAMPAIASYFSDLDADNVRAAFRQLAAQIDAYKRLEAFEMERVYQEYLFLLNELMVKNLVDGDPLPLEAFRCSSWETVVEELAKLYVSKIEALIHQRKYKKKLNLQDIKSYIEINFARPITVEKIAQVYFVSYVYLSRAFKSEFAINITDYIQKLRLEKAKEWIVFNQIPIKAVAEMCGYEDIAYFYRVFKKYFGISPGEMRKKQEGS
ncbi:response regulator transcription factor [Paenibacillus puerhi]|uniref:response regulator transcription factor n=1 Tax=Paenibacillus puerhi TaxID=2692622 RepID=UPI00135CE651|nr:response regulator [Paenibacillus puerhi]